LTFSRLRPTLYLRITLQFYLVRQQWNPRGVREMGEDRQKKQPDALGPGQIWLIEQVSDAALCPLDRAAMTSAQIIVYDPALAPLVAAMLPIGGYAEPLSRDAQAAEATISPRTLEFAAAGWSVAQLIEARPGCHARLRGAVAALPSAGAGGDLPVRVIAKGAPVDSRQSREACVRTLPALIDQFADEDPLTLIFGPFAIGQPAASAAFTANGLAG
jgi:hypothetical protein